MVDSLQPQSLQPRRRSGAFSRLAAATAIATYALVVLGAVVRATDSGLGCPDWPRCFGGWVPPFRKEALIEYSHRSLAVVVGIMAVALLALAWKERKRAPGQFWLTAGAFVLLGFQAWLGRQVVLGELDALMVTVHLGTAMVLLALLIMLAFPPLSIEAITSRRVAALWLAAFGVYSVVVLGALVRGEGAGLAFPDWPLMGGQLVPDGLEVTLRLVHFLHRLLALVVGIYLFYLARHFLRRQRDAEMRLAMGVFVLYLVQVMIGAAAVWSDLNAVAAVSHVALAALIWGAVFALPLLSAATEASPAGPRVRSGRG